ncbi:MAG: hypothetical protein GX974_06675 [Clostridiales bacterium]|nr:hypothetical protein [Clostridiales bacterium]
MHIIKLLPPYIKETKKIIGAWILPKKVAIASLLSALAAILQAAGGLLPGIGLFISPLSTMPIMLSTMISFRYGLASYILTNVLLVLLEPSEIIIFAFTTGLLGLGMGWGIRTFNYQLSTLGVSSLILMVGICIPLYILGYPILGPAISTKFDIKPIIIIFAFSILYSLLWLKLALYIIRLLHKLLSIKNNLIL